MEYILFSLMLMSLFSFSTPLQSSALSDQQSLLMFKAAITSDPNNALANWNTTIPMCNWTGVTCSPNLQKVVGLNLTDMDLQGVISPAVGNLTALVKLVLPFNQLYGRIPDELGKLTRLSNLSLLQNYFTGTIPPSTKNLSALVHLDFSQNYLHGPIPPEIGMLTQLQFLSLGSNQLSGSIPSSIGNLSQLNFLQLPSNNLEGLIPSEIGYLTKLQLLRFYDNQLSGTIPFEVGLLINLQRLSLWGNELSGIIPNSLGNCSNMEILDLRYNQLSGTVPHELGNLLLLRKIILEHNRLVSSTNIALPFITSLTNCSHLQYIKLSHNNLSGVLPPSIGHFSSNLSIFDLGNNMIRGNIPPQITNLTNLTYLNLSNNLLNGYLPSGLKRLYMLERLDLSGNSIGGGLQEDIGEMKSLRELDVSWNKLSGKIPGSLGRLQQLRRLFLHHNDFSGDIPSGLQRCQNLELVDFSHNKLSGNIPGEVMGSLQSLQLYLNLSSNFLQGPLPAEISKIVNAQAIDISGNKLDGVIPAALSNCIALEHLNLSHNAFEGPIPDALGKLQNLESVDLSVNFLSGTIPTSLKKMKVLRYFNASFNNLTGRVPDSGLFSNNTFNASFLGNPGLCGPEKYLVHACPNQGKRTKSLLTKVMLPAAGMIAILLSFLIFVILWHRKYSSHQFDLPDVMFGRLGYPKFTYQDLVNATNGFNETNFLGSGTFGSAFKGVSRDGVVVAIKVFSFLNEELQNSFERECEILAVTRHRNLIRVISVCSYLNFKALILQFATNGSLEKHLYPESSEDDVCELKIDECLNIAIDVAHGMEYLHHDCPTQVVHCDLKPSNVLLDANMTALVADFGISRLACPTNLIDSLSTSIALRGTIGYIAPEYGLGMNISTKGDVYSYGILLLEMITRKRPTDAIFANDVILPKWVRSAFPQRLADIVDRRLLENVEIKSNDYLVAFINIGLLCTSESPHERPTMRDVRRALEVLRTTSIGDAASASNLTRTISDLLVNSSAKATEEGIWGSDSSTY